MRNINIKSCDKTLLLICIILMIFGLALQLDIGSSRGGEYSLVNFKKQVVWFLVSLPAMIIIAHFKKLFELLNKYSFFLLLLTIILLVLVLMIGSTQKEGTRWLRFGGIGIQPSMVASITLILYTAKILDKKKLYLERSTFINFIKDFLPLLIIIGIVFGLIYAEKHLSTLIVISIAILSMLFMAQVRISTLILAVLLIGSLSLFLIKYGKEDYRSSRMDMFSHYSLYHKFLGIKASETQADDYQIKESLTAITHGNIFGTGNAKGRAKHYFLPDAKSDYIFAIIAEQYGFLGALLIIFLYTFIVIKSLNHSIKTDNLFLQLVGVGLSLNFFLPAMVNIGVSISALPPTGLNLPFLSYGGTSFLMNAINMGLILNLSVIAKGV